MTQKQNYHDDATRQGPNGIFVVAVWATILLGAIFATSIIGMAVEKAAHDAANHQTCKEC
jgi:hypothetical protein